jgi:hypothetical protein
MGLRDAVGLEIWQVFGNKRAGNPIQNLITFFTPCISLLAL